MRHRRISLALLSAALVALSIGACDRPEQGALKSPTEPRNSVGSLVFSNQSYTPVRETVSLGAASASLSKLIGAEGGELQLAGHSIRVPEGAVQVPTVFTLAVVPSGLIEVDLRAVVESALGAQEVGSRGFAKPVRLTLTYARAEVSDPSALKVLWVTGDHLSGYKVLGIHHPTVDTENRTVTAQLQHFSRYMMASP